MDSQKFLEKLKDKVESGAAYPLNCTHCGAGMYAVPPAGWVVGKALRVRCAQCKALTRFTGEGGVPERVGNRHQRRAMEAAAKRALSERRANDRLRNANPSSLGKVRVAVDGERVFVAVPKSPT